MNTARPITERTLQFAKLDIGICLGAAASLALVVAAWVI